MGMVAMHSKWCASQYEQVPRVSISSSASSISHLVSYPYFTSPFAVVFYFSDIKREGVKRFIRFLCYVCL